MLEYFILRYQGRSQGFWFGGRGKSDKIFSTVARISVRSGDIQQKFTQQRLFKKFENLY